MSDRCREEAGMQANFCDTNYAQVPDWNYKFVRHSPHSNTTTLPESPSQSLIHTLTYTLALSLSFSLFLRAFPSSRATHPYQEKPRPLFGRKHQLIVPENQKMNCYVAMMKPAQRVCVGPDAKHLRSPQLAYPCPRTFGTARYYAYMGWLPGMPRRGSFGRKWDSNDHARCVDMASGRGRS